MIPLDQFRELVVAMALGVIIDAFVVRSLMVPAMVALFGNAGSWPAGRGVGPPGSSALAARTTRRSWVKGKTS